VRCTAGGELVWERTYGGDLNDDAVCAAPTPDGGVAAFGSTWSAGAGGADGWAVMLDPEGRVEWARTYGGAEMERLFDAAAIPGGFVATGTTYSEGSHGDVLTLWVDGQGLETARMVWGCPGYDYGRAVLPVAEGVAVACWSKRSACNVAVILADSTGTLTGESVIPTGYNIRAEALLLSDRGFLVGGTAETGSGGDLDVFVWLVTPAGERLWELVRGGTGGEEMAGMALTPRGGLVLAGTTTSTDEGDSDVWLLGLEPLQGEGDSDGQ
jgi:hypothetical protein